MNNSISLLLPGLVVAATALLALFLDVAGKAGRRSLAWVSSAGLVAAAAVAVGQWMTWDSGWRVWRIFGGGLAWRARDAQVGFNNMVAADHYGLFFTILFCAVGVLTIMLSERYLERHGAKPGEFYALLLLVITGMIGMAISNDVIALLISFELMSLPSYVLAGLLRGERKSLEASIKYFVNGAFASAVLTFGLALLYGLTGGTSYFDIRGELVRVAPDNGMLLVALVMVCTGFGFKVAAVPFHGWAPDVYEGAPTPITAFMSVGVKAGAFAGIVRLFGIALLPGWQTWTNVLIALAVLTMVGGNVLALPQRNLKRMLAYSSIAHAGYLLLGVIAVGRSLSYSGAGAILFYLVAYTLMNLGAFGILILIRNRRSFSYSLDEIAGLGRTMPLAALAMTLFMLSLTGIPPLAGFWGKFYLFTAVIDARLTWLAIVAVVMSTVSAFYYLRVVWYMFFREFEGEAPETVGTTVGVGASLAVAAVGVVLVGLYPSPFISAAQTALSTMLGMK